MRTLKILGVVVVALAVSAAAVGFWIRHAADRKWAAAQERIRAMAAAHPVVVPPLPSTPASKNLQIQFVAAIREAARRNGRAGEARVLTYSPKRGSADGVLDDAQGFLDLLHQAARTCAAAPSDFPPGWRGEWDTTTVQFMVHCCVLRARQLREQKAPFDATLTLLDALHLSRFWSISGKEDHLFDVMASLAVPMEELIGILSQETLSRDELLQVERELEPIDRAFPSPIDTLEPLLARWAESLETFNGKDVDYMSRAAYRWRFFLPESLMKADAFEACERHVRMLVECREQPYPEIERRLGRIGEEVYTTKNPLLDYTYPFGRVGWPAFSRLSQVRLLRAAAHYRATGEILTIKDPCGDGILHAPAAGRMRFWSSCDGSYFRVGTRVETYALEVDPPKPE